MSMSISIRVESRMLINGIHTRQHLYILILVQHMTTVNAEEIVSEQIRDTCFKQLKKINKNNICIDCEKKNPTWASIHLGVHLCIDCAGKHRQYGVMYSFVKSTNLDKWNRKQLMFMQKGGNQRAIQYLTKSGVIGQHHKHIDYKSPIVQRYKGILTGEVQGEIIGKPFNTNANTNNKQSSTKQEKVQQTNAGENNGINAPKEIGHAEHVEVQEKTKKKNKKKVGKKINLQDFDALVLDDGVPIQEKQKIVKAYESNIKQQQTSTQQKPQGQQQSQTKTEQPVQPAVQAPKQMTVQQSKQRLQQLKSRQNVKSISSDQFKDTTISSDNLKQNLNKFQGSQSISSNSFFGGAQTSTEDGTVDKIKDFVTDASGKLYGKLSSYWAKK